MMFVAHGRPAVAITSDNFAELSSEITHTEKDRVELADPGKLAALARALDRLVRLIAA